MVCNKLVISVLYTLILWCGWSSAGTIDQDKRCSWVYHLKEWQTRGQCDGDRLLCLCLCDPQAEVSDYDEKCCPPSPFPVGVRELEQSITADTSGHCFLFRNFDCYKNVTESCRGAQLTLKNSQHFQTYIPRSTIRSFLLSEGCVLLRETLDSLCPFRGGKRMIKESGILDNLITVNSENLWCQCGGPPQPTTTPPPLPPKISPWLYVLISGGIAALVLVAVLIFAWRAAVKRMKCEQDCEHLVGGSDAMPDTPLPWRSPQPLRLHSFLGEGKFGVVYRAEHILMKRTVAIKRIKIFSVVDAYHPNIGQFMAEAQLLVQICNDHVVKLHNCWVENAQGTIVQGEEEHWFSEIVDKYSKNYWSSGRKCKDNPDLDYVLFLQMEFCESDLDKVLQTHRTFEERDAFINFTTLVRHLVSGLKALHHFNIIHRDIKPANVLYTNGKWNSGKIWKIGDLGLSKEKSSTEENAFVGTSMYMSPEMLNAETNGTEMSDVFSLGLTLLEAMCPSSLDMKNHAFGQVKIRSSFPQYLDTLMNHLPNNLALEGKIVRQMLELDPALRPSISHVYDKLLK